MPLPAPRKNEKQDEFISRCMGDETTVADFPDNDQRAAVCFRQWRGEKANASMRADALPGGKADGMKAEDFDPAELAEGIKHEMEHTDNPTVAAEIAMDHLAEDPDYYRKLKRAGLAAAGKVVARENVNNAVVEIRDEAGRYVIWTRVDSGLYSMEDILKAARQGANALPPKDHGKHKGKTKRYAMKFQAKEINQDVLRGVVICEKGEADGHGVFLGDKFLDQVVSLCKGRGVKVRVNHPEEGKPGDVVSIVGEATNFWRDGDKVRADVQLFDVPKKRTILALAEQAAHLFGMSLDFILKTGAEVSKGIKEAFCEAVNAVDFVEQPAAASALFQEKVDSGKKDSMTINLPDKVLEGLALSDEAKKDEKAVLAALEGAMAKAAKYDEGEKAKAEAGKDEGEGAKADEGDNDEDEEDEGEKSEACKANAKIQKTVERLVAAELTKALAKVGAQGVRFSAAEGTPAPAANRVLSDEEKRVAKRLGLDEKAYLAQLEAADKRRGQLGGVPPSK